MSEAKKTINEFRERVSPGGDLNDACIALEELRKQPLGQNDVWPAVNVLCELVMGIITAGTGVQPIASRINEAKGNKVATQVQRLPQEALEKFKKQFGSDGRFSALTAALEEVVPAYQELMQAHNPDKGSRGKDIGF